MNSLSRIPPSLAEQPPHGNSLFYWVSPNSRSEPKEETFNLVGRVERMAVFLVKPVRISF